MDMDVRFQQSALLGYTNCNISMGMFFRDHEADPPKASRPFHNLKALVATVLPSTNGTLLSFSQALDEVGHAQTSQKFLQELYEDIHKTRLEVGKTRPSGAVLHNTIQSMGTADVQVGIDRGEISWALKVSDSADKGTSRN
ncbi:hypothetical protein BO79DRAFT_243540 [Aspergillus costaricaensis CBS 115574]|uniref:Uncharacterized protein n=1 Tax=Aspergillus costaricaensis CBS 115574 TaxID=1448317 RepID=A0ACD1IQD2_9EURO|nr:hypothetical protein BO79DRAFT_243540 [Aspergillus costaricaensis CBS 115574]RAK91907.1 hypothetical protein BO79DRAFT_243540 [Aspergillus costaricaensis CBS 115574]